MKQTIAIIDAVNEQGAAIAQGLAGSVYRLLLLSTDINRLEQLQQHMLQLHPAADIDILACMKDGCWEADIIILALPRDTEATVAQKISEVATQKIVISVPESIPDDGAATGSIALQNALPWSKVVTAFNAISLNDFSTDKEKISYITGNDEDALTVAGDIMDAAGWAPVTNKPGISYSSNIQ